MLKTYKILFFNFLIIGTLTAISSLTWFTAWLGLEINLLSIIPLLKSSKNKFPAESVIKYFIIQAMGSSIFLFSILVIKMNFLSSLSENFNLVSTLLLSTSLLMKMGAAPFHFWLPEVLSGLSWINTFIVLTWQKIAPSMLLMYLTNQNLMFFSLIIIFCSIIGGIQGFNQICLRKIMAYSSINHMGWMICTLLYSSKLWLLYFLVYSFTSLSMIMFFKKYNIFYTTQLSNCLMSSKKLKPMFMLNFLSLGGLPPFLGFLPKWLTINSMIESHQYTIITLLVIFTLLSLYFYLRITLSSFTMNSEESMINKIKKMNYIVFFFNSINILGLVICAMLNLI